MGPRSGLQRARVGSEPHRAAQVVHTEQIAQLVDHVLWRVGRALGRVRVGQPADVTREFDRRPLEAVADPEVGNALLAGDLRRSHHAAGAAVAETSRHEDAVRAVEELFAAGFFERLGFHPADVHAEPVLEAAVVQRLVQALVPVLISDVLADHVNGDFVGRVLDPVHQVGPRIHPRFRLRQVQAVQHDAIEAFGSEDERHFIDARDVLRRDHRFLVHVAEQRDLLLDVLIEESVGAAEQNVGLNPDGAQVAHAVLGRLGLELAGRADEGHEREVDVERVLPADVLPELADGLDERQALDVADRAADLDQDDVDVPGDGADRVLDFVGDVRDDLHRAAEIVAAALLLDHLQVNLAGRPVVVARRHLVRETFVVTQIEVCLRSVVGDVHLAVLERAHRARVDVDIRIELLEGDLVAVPLEQRADGRRRESLAE